MQQPGIGNVDTEILFSDFDREFGKYLLRSSGIRSRLLFMTGMLLSYELRSGRTVLNFSRYAGKTLPLEDDVTYTLPDEEEWHDTLSSLEFVPVIAPSYLETEVSPLVFVRRGMVMLRRYAELETELRELLLRRRKFAAESQLVFPAVCGEKADYQDLAVFVALNSSLLILSGGPGTGKTTVCGRILQELFAGNPQMNILFAAPTGKAQQRLAGQIMESAAKLPENSPVRKAMESMEGATMHSFICNRSWRRKLEFCDLLLLDECSMIPLELFAGVLKLLPERAGLILTGDRKQLASVESGSVYGDMCDFGKVNQLPPAAAQWFNSCGGEVGVYQPEMVDDFTGFIVELKKNYRAASAPEICRISDVLRNAPAADAAKNAAMLSGMASDDFYCCSQSQETLAEAVRQQLKRVPDGGIALAGLPELCVDPGENEMNSIFRIMEEHKFICALNLGRFGTAAINEIILDELKLVPDKRSVWEPGTILLITRNDKRTRLRNGDMAVVTLEYDSNGRAHRVARFPAYPEMHVPLAELPPHECGFAISIHKSQGSGYANVVLIMPEQPVEILSVELLYTGITRAAKRVELWAREDILQYCLEHKTERLSNLFSHEV